MKNSANFFKNAKMAVSFRGRILTKEQERLVVETIVQSCGIHILCIVDEPKEHGERTSTGRFCPSALEEKEDQDGQFYRGSLRAGQVLENEEGSIVILGDAQSWCQCGSQRKCDCTRSLQRQCLCRCHRR